MSKLILLFLAALAGCVSPTYDCDLHSGEYQKYQDCRDDPDCMLTMTQLQNEKWLKKAVNQFCKEEE